jgi:hypothetical protein
MTRADRMIAEGAPMRGPRVLVIHDDHVRRLWVHALETWFDSEAIIKELPPERAWLPSERPPHADYDAIILPLSVPDMGSLTLAYVVRALRVPCKLILSSNTRTDPELILRLFDDFVERTDGYSYDRQWFQNILDRPPPEQLTGVQLEDLISHIIDDAQCFKDHHGYSIGTLRDFYNNLHIQMAFSAPERRAKQNRVACGS